jgi:ankyrin repeat protein
VSSTDRRRSTGSLTLDSDDTGVVPADFSLVSKRRVCLMEGAVNIREQEGKFWKTSRRYLFLFNDLFLIATRRDKKSLEDYDIHRLIWMDDLRVVSLGHDDKEDPGAVEIAIGRMGHKATNGTVVIFDTEAAKDQWVQEIANTCFAYHLGNKRVVSQMGWHHEIMQGTLYSAAYFGDQTVLRRLLRLMDSRNEPMDLHDESGMCAVHWCSLRGHEACLRLLLDKGTDVDVPNAGLNSPLLLAVCQGYDGMARLLLDKGADPFARNARDQDCVTMAVLYGHSSKGLPWVLQLLNSRGADLNQPDVSGATPLHMCAAKNLARPVRMLVDAGADVNCRHQTTQLTPLQMACAHPRPDVETIRSFLDKGAFANWRDLAGRTAFDMVLDHLPQDKASSTSSAERPSVFAETLSSPPRAGAGAEGSEVASVRASSFGGYMNKEQAKYATMDEALTRVGEWAVHCLPVLLEIAKKGGRFEEIQLDVLRRSFKEAVMEAREAWAQKKEPINFVDFVLAREQAGEELRTNKTNWSKDGKSPNCRLCAEDFGLKNRRHHCRACGSLVCEYCSSKRLQLSVISDDKTQSSRDSMNDSTDKRDRICDGCYIRLSFEASQPSPDHYRIKQLKICAKDLMRSVAGLVDALEDGQIDGDGPQAPASANTTPVKKPMRAGGVRRQDNSDHFRSNEALIDAIRLRDDSLTSAEHLANKFLEAADGYHRIAKKLIEEKIANNRLWGMQTGARDP